MVPPSSSANLVNSLTFWILAFPASDSSSLMFEAIISLLLWYRDPSGIPSLYLPVRRPESSGDQMVLLAHNQHLGNQQYREPHVPRPSFL